MQIVFNMLRAPRHLKWNVFKSHTTELNHVGHSLKAAVLVISSIVCKYLFQLVSMDSLDLPLEILAKICILCGTVVGTPGCMNSSVDLPPTDWAIESLFLSNFTTKHIESKE